MYYSEIKKKIKESYIHGVDGAGMIKDPVNYNSEYVFKMEGEAYKRLWASTAFTVVIFGIIGIVGIKDVDAIVASSGEVTWVFMLMFSMFMLGLALYSYNNKYHKVYPKVMLEYKKGIIVFNDGRKTYTFGLKSISSIVFYNPNSYGKGNWTNKWAIKIRIKGEMDFISIDLANMENPEILFKLLTSFNPNVQVLF